MTTMVRMVEGTLLFVVKQQCSRTQADQRHLFKGLHSSKSAHACSLSLTPSHSPIIITDFHSSPTAISLALAHTRLISVTRLHSSPFSHCSLCLTLAHSLLNVPGLHSSLSPHCSLSLTLARPAARRSGSGCPSGTSRTLPAVVPCHVS